MSKPKRWAIVLAGLLAGAGLSGAWLYRTVFAFTPGVTQENFDRLHAGMKVDQVKTILGEPVSGYSRRTLGVTKDGWRDYEEGPFIILFHAEGELEAGLFYAGKGKGPSRELAPSPEPFLARLRRWLPLP